MCSVEGFIRRGVEILAPIIMTVHLQKILDVEHETASVIQLGQGLEKVISKLILIGRDEDWSTRHLAS